jgi:hypothetical protein
VERVLFETKAATKKDQPINLSSEKFTEFNYGVTAYYKTAEWLRWLESTLGTETFNKAMQEYYRRWQFKHPQPEDFKKTMEDVSGKDLAEAFSYLGKTGLLPSQRRKGTKFIFNPLSIIRFDKDPAKEMLLVGPAVGMNSYDNFMLGAFITNIKLPPSATQFFLSALYATGTKRFAGLGFLSHSFYFPGGKIHKTETGISVSRFTMDEFEQSNGEKIFLGVEKIVPQIKISFREKNPRSHRSRTLQFKSFWLNEDRLSFTRQALPGGGDTLLVSTREVTSGINRLQYTIENNRALYPYMGQFRIDQGEDFARASFTGKYFFNYSKAGGLDVRLFAGKFFYTSGKTISKQFATDRYHLNMTGPNGYEDYTYSDYFIGRNRFEGLPSQQIMIRDGAFKTRTDLLAAKVGKTDDWLVAANLSSTIPSAINPLSILPLPIHLKIFVDIGTYAEAWKQNSTEDRFLYNAGIQIPIRAETINIYIPVLYSSVYRAYYHTTIPKKGRLWKLISFTIDISNLSLKKLESNLTF